MRTATNLKQKSFEIDGHKFLEERYKLAEVDKENFSATIQILAVT